MPPITRTSVWGGGAVGVIRCNFHHFNLLDNYPPPPALTSVQVGGLIKRVILTQVTNYLSSDDLNSGHEFVTDNGHPNEQVQQNDKVEEGE